MFDFINVINDEAKLNQALIKDKRVENLFHSSHVTDERQRRASPKKASSRS